MTTRTEVDEAMHSTNDSATTIPIEAEFPWLYLDSKLYPEGRSRGLLVCGLEWGGENGAHDPIAAREGQSFFSDRRERYPFRRGIISWFERWGHPLRDTDPGPFERSIVHMNWLPTKARKIKGRRVLTELLEPKHADRFWRHVETFEPRLILFFGSPLLSAFAETSDTPTRTAVLGALKGEGELLPADYIGRRFQSRHMAYERCDVVGLPHPNARIKHATIDVITPAISPLIARLKSGVDECAGR